MTEDELAELLRDCPVLYHMAEAGSWPGIARHGLLSTSALLDLFAVPAEARAGLEAQHRPETTILTHPVYGRAVLRDQKPMDDAGLARCLRDGLTPADWYRLLNGRVFLWPSEDRLRRLLHARPYRGRAHDVIMLDAAPLVRAYRDRIELCPINSGATKPFAQPRGRDTFLPIAACPFAQWRGRRKAGERVVEITIPGGIPDVARYVRSVTQMRAQ